MFDKKKIIVVVISLVGIIIGFVYFFINSNDSDFAYLDGIENNTESVKNVENIANAIQEETIKGEIVVHIIGEVLNQGVISLNQGARLIDAINLAGGLTSKADISKVNLAYVLEDAQRIYIPSVDDKEESLDILEGSGNNKIVTNGVGGIESSNKKNLKVNINTANEEQLQNLAGIGDSIAKRIIDYRKENGKFNNIEDIKNVSGIGENKFNKIKDSICVK